MNYNIQKVNSKKFNKFTFIAIILYFEMIILEDIGLSLYRACLYCISLICLDGLKYLKKYISLDLFLYIILIFFSEYYNNKYKFLSLEYAIFILSPLLCASAINKNTNYNLYKFLQGIIIILIPGILYIKLNGTPDPNSPMRLMLEHFTGSFIGFAYAMCYFIGFSLFLEKPRTNNVLIMLLGISGIFLGFSKNAIIAIAFISFIISYQIGKIKLNKNIFIFIISLIILAFIFGNYIDTFTDIMNSNIKNEGKITYSGRTSIWEACYELIYQNPIFGNGYWTANSLLEEIAPWKGVNQAHSAYFQALITVGIIGSICLWLYMIRIFIYLQRLIKKQKDWSTLFLYNMYLYFLIRGFTEGSYAQAGSFDVFIFFIVTFCIKRKYKLLMFSKLTK